MSVTYNSSNFGLFPNGSFENGTTSGFSSWGTIYGDGYQGQYSMKMSNYVQPWSDTYVLVDPSQNYTFSFTAKTIKRSSPNNYLGQGYVGFACFDQFYNFVDLRNEGGNGNTTLTRAANPGDTYIYIATNSGWGPVTDAYYFRNVLFFPATHPYYGTAWQYTRFGFGDYTLYYSEITSMGGGEWRLRLSTDGTDTTTLPNMGYSLPIGTPIARGVAGGSYNYVFVTEFPEVWTTYNSGNFTGMAYTSSTPFRYGTKYVKAMILSNYGHSGETTAAQYLLDNIVLAQSSAARTYNLG